jgi:DNA-binding MarR family transcriptional regulator
MNNKSNNKTEEKTLIEEIDKAIHEPARMKIMAILYFVESMDALFLLRQTGLSWGNLATHTRKLEAVDYVEVKKEFIRRKTHTMFRLTQKGRNAFETYVKHMRHLFEGFSGQFATTTFQENQEDPKGVLEDLDGRTR